MQQLKNKFIIFAALAITGPVFFISTSPNNSPLYLLLLPFLYFFLLAYIVPSILFDVLAVKSKSAKKVVPVVSSVLVTAVLILGSLDQLSIIDVILLITILFLLSWYIFRLSSSR